MTAPQRDRGVRRRAVVILPNGATLASLFLGVFAIVAASRGEFSTAGLYVVLAGIADALDGRIARATRTDTRFGSELDSLVDAITFGLAPALIMYFAVLNREGWDWIFVFLFTACAVIRLARFNVEQAGRAKQFFHGLPSPAAGMTLATYYPFSQTSFYEETVIGDLPWAVMLRWVMAVLAFLMISNVSYPTVPTLGYRTPRELLGTTIVAATFLGILFLPREFFFPALMLYVLYGLVKTVIYGFLDMRAEGDEPVITDELAAAGAPALTVQYGGRRRRRRRRHRGDRHGPPFPDNPPA